MSAKKITYNTKTRNDISNPYGKYSYTQLLRKANVQNFNGSYEVKQLNNGRIKVQAIQRTKKGK